MRDLINQGNDQARKEPSEPCNHGLKISLRKQPFLLALRRWERFTRRNVLYCQRKVLSAEEPGETEVFAGYLKIRIKNSLSFQDLTFTSLDCSQSKTFRNCQDRARTGTDGHLGFICTQGAGIGV